MRYVSLRNLQPGMQVGKPVYGKNSYGTTIPLLTARNILSESTINILKLKAQRGEIEVRGLYIEDSLSQGIEIEDVFKEETINATMAAIRDKKIKDIMEKSKELVSDIRFNTISKLDLVKMIETNDLEAHSMNVCELALALAINLNFTNREMYDLSNAALLHDIGRFLEDKKIKDYEENIKAEMKARKPEDVSSMDFFHNVYGYVFLSSPEYNSMVSAITKQAILFSHEDEKGTGFPFGFAGATDKKITKYSKILLICDKYEHYLKEFGNPIDARTKLQEDYALGIIDKSIAEVFIKKIPIFPISSNVLLSDGREALIVRNNDGLPERPVVRTFDGEVIDLVKSTNITVTELLCFDESVSLEQENKPLMRK